jgi:hypothetical protein
MVTGRPVSRIIFRTESGVPIDAFTGAYRRAVECDCYGYSHSRAPHTDSNDECQRACEGFCDRARGETEVAAWPRRDIATMLCRNIPARTIRQFLNEYYIRNDGLTESMIILDEQIVGVGSIRTDSMFLFGSDRSL